MLTTKGARWTRDDPSGRVYRRPDVVCGVRVRARRGGRLRSRRTEASARGSTRWRPVTSRRPSRSWSGRAASGASPGFPRSSYWFEAGRDGFWLHRCLTAHGVSNVVRKCDEHRAGRAGEAREDGPARMRSGCWRCWSSGARGASGCGWCGCRASRRRTRGRRDSRAGDGQRGADGDHESDQGPV